MAPTKPFYPRSSRLPGGCWPTPEQTLLLRAALLEPAAAVPAWEEWQRRVDFDQIDSGSFRLLGLVYRNLSRAGFSDALTPRLKGVYRRFWSANQLLLGRNAATLNALKEAGIPVMLTKGAAMIVSTYQDYGARPMDDLDVMVPRAQAVQAMEVLESLGWKSVVLYSRNLPESTHACLFRHEVTGCIDLHWQLFHVAVPAKLDTEIWRGVLTFPINGYEIHTPSYTDQFLRSCEHGVRYCLIPPFRWLADCYAIWQVSKHDLDWERIATNARIAESVMAVRETMRYLRDHLEVELPARAFELLENAPVTFHERVENRMVRRSYEKPLDKLPVDVLWYIRKTRGQSLLSRIAGFKKYYLHTNNLAPGQFTSHRVNLMRHWLRHWLPYYLRRVRHARFRDASGAIRYLPEGCFQDFHGLEPHGPRLIRWSHPQAAMRLRFPRSRDFRIRLEIGRLRPWSELSGQTHFYVNGVPVPAEQVQHEKGAITLQVYDLDLTAFTDPHAVIAWTCPSVVSTIDSRPLGLPVYSITVHPLTSPSPEERKLPDNAEHQLA